MSVRRNESESDIKTEEQEMKGGEMFLGPIESASRGYIGLLLEKMYKEKSYLKREFLIFNLKCVFPVKLHETIKQIRGYANSS